MLMTIYSLQLAGMREGEWKELSKKDMKSIHAALRDVQQAATAAAADSATAHVQVPPVHGEDVLDPQ
jgi:hypothetical protein